ncbi:MAG: hypothetical protein M3Y48_22420 [Actinomycetota bacterium]|nr:hypothetical protein [Actinomycetota bacterium]
MAGLQAGQVSNPIRRHQHKPSSCRGGHCHDIVYWQQIYRQQHCTLLDHAGEGPGRSRDL